MKKLFFIGLLAAILMIPAFATAEELFIGEPRDTQGVEPEQGAPVNWGLLWYNTVSPVRCYDTRDYFAIVPGGTTVSSRLDQLCSIPFPGAKAVHIYIAAFNAFGAGNIRGFAYNDPLPGAAILNYGQIPGLFAIGNAVTVPLCGAIGCSYDLSIWNSTTCHHTVDVLGYFD